MLKFNKKVLVMGHKGGIGQATAEHLRLRGMFDIITLKPDWRYPENMSELNRVKADAIVNCIGYIAPQPIIDEVEANNTEMDINYHLPAKLMHMFPYAEHINIGSSAATKPRKNWSGYCASKAALHMLTRCAARESINAVCIAPGRTATPMRTRVAGRENPNTLLSPWAIANVVDAALRGEYPNGSIINVKLVGGITHVECE